MDTKLNLTKECQKFIRPFTNAEIFRRFIQAFVGVNKPMSLLDISVVVLNEKIEFFDSEFEQINKIQIHYVFCIKINIKIGKKN